MRDHLRAIFILFHLAAIGSLCIPAPVGGLSERSYNNANIQAIFREYSVALNRVGLRVTRKELQDTAWAAGQWLVDVRKAALQPFVPYHRATGTQQGWRMFGYVNRTPARVEVRLQRVADGPWEPLYFARSDAHDWRRRQLDQERFRALLNSASHRRSKKRYERAVDWLADRAAEDFPEAHALAAQMVYQPAPPPEDLRELDALPTGEAFWRTERLLSERR